MGGAMWVTKAFYWLDQKTEVRERVSKSTNAWFMGLEISEEFSPRGRQTATGRGGILGKNQLSEGWSKVVDTGFLFVFKFLRIFWLNLLIQIYNMDSFLLYKCITFQRFGYCHWNMNTKWTQILFSLFIIPSF